MYVTIESVGFHPHMVCLLLPPVLRQEIFFVDNKKHPRWFNYRPYKPNLDPLERILHDSATNLLSQRQRYIEAFRSLLLLKYYLETKNIPFYFGFWDTFEFKDEITDIQIDNEYVMNEYCPHSLQSNYIKGTFDKTRDPHVLKAKAANQPFPQTIARDFMHCGPNAHHDYANVFYDQLKASANYHTFISTLSKLLSGNYDHDR